MLRAGVLVLFGLATTTCASAITHKTKDICHGEVCYPAVFVPSSEFAVVHDDQSIPPGLNVRINLETGVKEARLLSSSNDQSDAITGDLAVVPGEDAHESPDILDEHTDKPFPPTKPLVGSDRSSFGTALGTLQTEHECNQDVMSALDLLEDLVHELEFGLEMTKSADGLSRLLHFMQDSSTSCRANAALVLGSALQNNENAILAIPEGFPLISQLLSLIAAEQNNEAKKMFVYALSASMAQPGALKDFETGEGHQTLSGLYSSGSDEVRAKIASFVEDHFAQENGGKHRITLQHESDYEARLGQIDALEKWCNTFQESLLGTLSTVTATTKLMSAVSQIKRTNRDTCVAQPQFLNYLAKESLKDISDSTEELVQLARDARSLFGNHKASRKHRAAYL